MKKVLVTGGAGFFGHHLVEHLLKETDYEIVVLDKLNYASKGYDRLRDIGVYDDRRITRFAHDFTLPIVDGLAHEIGAVDYILHVGAETHVDNSISNPEPFVRSNVLGTFQMLEYARRIDSLEWFLYFSTDEVFGPAPGRTNYKEWDRYNSTNPYSATKAAGEELCLAWANTYKLPVKITHTMNLIGERQHPEKYVPSCIKKIIARQKITVHGDRTKTQAGSRFYLHARNAADAVCFILKESAQREKYNIVGQQEIDNLTLARKIAVILDMPMDYELVDFHGSRPGHDLRYGLDGGKLQALGWKPPVDFDSSLEKTVKWFVENPRWLE
jgi:dTDP-glucose 4,6-dehydratase